MAFCLGHGLAQRDVRGFWMWEPIMADRRIDITVEPKALHVLTPEVVSFTKEVHNLFDEVTRFFDKKLPYIFK